jgi:hypothetical protein
LPYTSQGENETTPLFQIFIQVVKDNQHFVKSLF